MNSPPPHQTPPIRPAVVTVGDELLYGERENGNQRWLLARLQELGQPAELALSLPDDLGAIAHWIAALVERGCAPILVSGGIGGTHDDCTRQAVAAGLGLGLELHPECDAILAAHYGERYTAQRRRMAELPAGCALLPNPGGAPGFRCGMVFGFPGFPDMLRPMAEAVLAEVLPLGDRIYDPAEVARIFYQHFSDSYEQLAFVSERIHLSPASGAAALGARSQVEGINMPLFDWSAYWSGPEALLSSIAYLRVGLMSNWVSLHETGHQWGFRWDLFDVAGVAPRGERACDGTAHAPLLADQVSFMSHCLNINDDRHPNLRIVRQGEHWVLAAPERPLAYHPLQLYAMGLLPAKDVPPLWLRLEQDRPRPLRPGARVGGEFVEVTIDEIVARYGERRGPVAPSVLRRAVIVVSPERLLSPRDLSWFNFFARRISDPDVTGIEDLDLTPSMEMATRGRVDLRTEIKPRRGRQVIGEFPVSYPRIGRRDLVGVRFDQPLATRYRVGRETVVSGRVEVARAHAEVRIRLGSRVYSGAIHADRRFSVSIAPQATDRGPQPMVVALGKPHRLLGSVAPVQVE